jgi:hypothetical protein
LDPEVEYISGVILALRDLCPGVIDLFLYEDFGKMIFWLVLEA